MLTLIYNICKMQRKIPSTWKKTNTILIYKKGDSAQPSNWRPIALGNTIYKLYASCLGKRLSEWIEHNGVLSPNQKGFLLHDGLFENNFLVDLDIRKSKLKRKDFCFASLDITNAFGTLPHWSIFNALRATGLGGEFSDIVRTVTTSLSSFFKLPEVHLSLFLSVLGLGRVTP